MILLRNSGESGFGLLVVRLDLKHFPVAFQRIIAFRRGQPSFAQVALRFRQQTCNGSFLRFLLRASGLKKLLLYVFT